MDDYDEPHEIDPIKALAAKDATDADASVPLAAIRPMFRPFDPMGPEAELQYDQVVRRLNRARAKRSMLETDRSELERQFVEDDLVVQSGVRRGQPLSSAWRRKRLNRLIELSLLDEHLREEERFANESLIRMNEALDRWARETYGA